MRRNFGKWKTSHQESERGQDGIQHGESVPGEPTRGPIRSVSWSDVRRVTYQR